MKHAKREAEGVASDNLAKPEEAVIAQLANASMTKKIETVRRVASRLGISDAAKMLTPKPRRKRTYS